MRQGLRSHLTFANVVSLIALSVALGGTTYAATGGNFILGQPNSASSTTSLTRTGREHWQGLAGDQCEHRRGRNGARLERRQRACPVHRQLWDKVANLNADRLDGLDSTSFVPNSKLRRVGPIADTLPPNGGSRVLPIATVGHFTFTGYCQAVVQPQLAGIRLVISSDAAHSTYASLTQSQAGGQFAEADMSAGTEYTVAIYGPTDNTGFPQFHPATGSAVAPDGQQVTFDVYQGAGARNQGNECIFGGTFAEK